MPKFDDALARLEARQPLPPLFPKQVFDAELSRHLLAPDDELDSNPALRCGLLLWNDDLHASHEISQTLENSTGSFWHAIMHRREGDAGNSNYWWRLTEDHPAFADVYEAAQKVLKQETSSEAQQFAAKLQQSGQWNPRDFVVACERALNDGNDEWLRRVQSEEMRALLNWCRINPL